MPGDNVHHERLPRAGPDGIIAGVVRDLLEAGMAAPSAVARDPWRFVVVRDRAMLGAIAAALPNGAMLASAGLGIVVAGELSHAHDRQLSYLLQDCSACVENVLPALTPRESCHPWRVVSRAMPRACFVAIDFETADYGRDSACAVGLVRVEGSEIVAREMRLIRPPRRDFMFTYIHGIEWRHVAKEPTFGRVWRDVQPLLAGAEFLAAHNASFDRSVLRACCASARIPVPEVEFVCSMKLARSTWNLYPTKLPDVCRHLGLALTHHDALSDASACAQIVMAATQVRAAARVAQRELP